MDKVDYQLVRSDRKTVSIQLKPDGKVVVRAPKRMKRREIDGFVESKRSWIETHLEKLPAPQPKLTPAELQTLARHAKEVIPEIVEHYAPLVGVTWGTITIRAQHTRWGSCTGKGNLNFNCLLMLAPDDVIEYVVVHELCHRKEMNHSSRFWAEVEKVFPDYRQRRGWLKENGQLLIGRLDA